ncbi:hypothetical protein HDU83_003202 [Entophlyctis luteolus]|nr:hypothetical protein HDU83_003202 [Entophlyctis luteolus]
MDSAQAASAVLLAVGAVFSTWLLSVLCGSKRLMREGLTRRVCGLLVVVAVSAYACFGAQVALTVVPQWFRTTAAVNEVFLAFRFSAGVCLASANLQIAFERYYVIVVGKNTPAIYTTAFIVHSVLTVLVLVISSETFNYRRPGGTWQPYVFLVASVQFMCVAFPGIIFCYFRTYRHIISATKEIASIAAGDEGMDVVSRARQIKRQVLVTCIGLTLSFCISYTPESVLFIYCIFSPRWEVPEWMDVAAFLFVALDAVVTPSLVTVLHHGLREELGSAIAGSSRILPQARTTASSK